MNSEKIRANIRPMIPQDLIWIKPIALKHNEWRTIRDTLFRKNDTLALCCWVIEGKAMVGLSEEMEDPTITYASGLCDNRGIKELFQLGRFLTTLARGFGLTLYSPEITQGSWQERFYEKMDFKRLDDSHFILPAED